MMQFKLTAIVVNDQPKAIKFYTETLGFELKTDIPIHGPIRWVGLVSPEAPDGTQLSLEPAGFEFAQTFQKALYDNKIPATAFAASDLNAEYERLKAAGVVFTQPPKKVGDFPATAVFDDTCGNLIQIFEG